MLGDEQRSRPVIELLAPFGADPVPEPATLGAASLGLGQFVEDGHARQILG